MCYQNGGLAAEVTHDRVNPNSTFTRIEILPWLESGFDDMVGGHARPERADRLIDFGLSDNRTTVACGQCQCGEILITRSRFPTCGSNEAIPES